MNNYQSSQAFGSELKQQGMWGILYHSVRDIGAQCVAVLRPPALAIPTVHTHLRYCWDGNKISDVFEIKPL